MMQLLVSAPRWAKMMQFFAYLVHVELNVIKLMYNDFILKQFNFDWYVQ